MVASRDTCSLAKVKDQFEELDRNDLENLPGWACLDDERETLPGGAAVVRHQLDRLNG